MTEPIDLNNLRDIINGNARSGTPSPTDPDRRVHVEPSGAVVVGTPEGARDKLSEVHQGVFSGGRPDEWTVLTDHPPSDGDLAARLRTMLVNRRSTSEEVVDTSVAPTDAPRRGRIQTSADVDEGDAASDVVVATDGAVHSCEAAKPVVRLSEVHQGVFSAAPLAQARLVADKLPQNTRWIEDTKARGWMYDVTNEFGDDYSFFIYHRQDNGLFFAMMIYPEVPATPDPHVAHYFRTGGLCLAPEVGLPTLDGCYAKSVIFSVGWSTYARTGVFPFEGAQ